MPVKRNVGNYQNERHVYRKPEQNLSLFMVRFTIGGKEFSSCETLLQLRSNLPLLLHSVSFLSVRRNAGNFLKKRHVYRNRQQDLSQDENLFSSLAAF